VSGTELPFLVWFEMKTKSLLIRKMQIALGSALLTLLAVGVVSYRATLASAESDRWLRHFSDPWRRTRYLDRGRGRLEAAPDTIVVREERGP
jgi:hypothetical protein